ncbi:MAG: YbjQ family protein, partial [Candidatus Gracilibacteria bacterium]|nr:YbjQ family protein [Candidatus Gracilibacteria bacterium]
MYLSTTHEIVGKKSIKNLGIINETVISGAFFVKDIFAAFRDVFGGRSKSYEKVVKSSRQEALDETIRKAKEKGANAIVGIKYDTEVLRGTM